MARSTAVPVLAHGASGKTDFASGVPSLLLELEQEKWEFPYQRGSYHREEMDVFLGELEAFGWNDGKLQGVGEHDDTVMAWWHLSWALGRLQMTGRSAKHRGIQSGSYI